MPSRGVEKTRSVVLRQFHAGNHFNPKLDSFRLADHESLRGIPDRDISFAIPSEDQPSIRTDGHSFGRPGVLHRRSDRAPGGHVPYAGGAVVARCDDPRAIRTEDRSTDTRFMGSHHHAIESLAQDGAAREFLVPLLLNLLAEIAAGAIPVGIIVAVKKLARPALTPKS